MLTKERKSLRFVGDTMPGSEYVQETEKLPTSSSLLVLQSC